MMSAGADHKLHRWNIEGAAKVAEVDCASDIFKIARGEDYVLVPCAGKRLVKVNLADNKISQEFAGHADWVISSVLHDNQLASGALDGEVRLWNLADGSSLHAWQAKP